MQGSHTLVLQFEEGNCHFQTDLQAQERKTERDGVRERWS